MKPFPIATVCFLTLATMASAQSTLGLPQVGQMLDRSGVLRSVHGIAGNFMLGDPITSNILSSACGPQYCLLKTDSQLLLTPATLSEPTILQTTDALATGPAIFAFRDNTAWIYCPQNATLTRFVNSAEPPTALAFDGEVLSMRATSHGLEFAIRRDNTVWIEAQDGSVLDSLPDADGPVLLLDNAVVYASGDIVKLKRPAANTIEFSALHASQISTISPRYVQILTDNSIYALKLDPGQEALFQLPEPQGPTRTVRRR